MGHLVTIEPGDHLPAIADEAGFSDWHTVWDAPENAELRDRRKDPGLLVPGDQVFVPDKQASEGVHVQSGTTARFRIKVGLQRLRVVMRGLDGKPLANTACTVTIDGAPTQATTGADGLVELDLPPATRDATLEADGVAWAMRVGHLDPAETDAGCWARLRNLGYLVDDDDGGEPDAPPDPELLAFAIELFQHDHGLPIDGSDQASITAKLEGGVWLLIHLPPAWPRPTRARDRLPVLVAPTLAGETNSLALPALPLACWRLEAARFGFDSSVVRPDAEPELTLLATMFDTTGGAALTVFGHADPVGDDEYNKALSGRRARAVYGLLVREPAIWRDLASAEQWPDAAYAMMQDRAGTAPGTPRDALILAYMDAICHRADGSAFAVEKSGFLGRGADPGGKGDVQGCSEFNPILRFSQADEQALSDPARKAERDERNAPNRRVLVFLFPPQMVVPASAWPCPRTSEASSGCRTQFWPDGDVRRGPQDREREAARDKTTFACAFYDRMARRSPCEAVRKSLEMRLFSAAHEAMPGARYRVTAGTQDVREGVADAQGNLKEDNLVAPNRVVVEWDFASSTGEHAFALTVMMDASHASDDAAIGRRLNNLGYVMTALTDNVHAFQVDYGISPATGTLDADTRARIIKIHDERLGKSEAGGA